MTTYLNLPADSVIPDPKQPRKHFDAEAITELAESIRQHGLLEPVIVRSTDLGNKDGYILIAGERRWRACREAGVDRIPARVMDNITEEAAFVLSVTENVVRVDMNPMEEANAFGRLRDEFGRDEAAIADLFGKTTRYVRMRLALLGLSEELQQKVAEGILKTAVAEQVAQCNAGNQQAMLFKLMRGDFANDNEAIHFAYALRQAEAEVGMFDVDEPSEEERVKRNTQKQKVLSLLARAERAVAALDELSALKPEDIATAIAGNGPILVARAEGLANAVKKVQWSARQAATLAEARDTARLNQAEAR